MAGFSLTRCLNSVKLGLGELPDVSESESAAIGLRIKDSQRACMAIQVQHCKTPTPNSACLSAIQCIVPFLGPLDNATHAKEGRQTVIA